MIYYVVLYFIRKAFLKHLKLVLAVSLTASIGLYWVFSDGPGFNMYGDTYYKWVHYFSFMLLGSIIGLMSKENPALVRNGWMELFKAFGCVVAYYALCAFKGSASLSFLQTLSLFPLLGVTYYVYRLCNFEGVKVCV